MAINGAGIKELHLCDFKSWVGDHVIGPFKTFSCIIGCNGSGKSNLMDAISFVLGVRTAQLRGNQLKDLIYRSPVEGALQPSNAFVEIVYEDAQLNATTFRRSVYPSSKSTYSVNGITVKWSEYEEELGRFGILVRARNFLVFQGDIESVAQKSPQELTDLFEQVSGSAQLSTNYHQLREAAKEAEFRFLRSFEKKKTLSKEKKQLKDQKDEAERYQNLQRSYQDLREQLFLWQLFHMDEHLSIQAEQRSEFKDQLDRLNESCLRIERDISKMSKRVGQQRRNRTAADRELVAFTKNLEEQNTSLIKIEEECAFFTSNLSSAENDYAKIEKENHERISVLKSIEDELASLCEKRSRLESTSCSSKDEFMLDDVQMAEYKQCKQNGASRTSSLREQRTVCERELNSLSVSHLELESRLAGLRGHAKQLRHTHSSKSARLGLLDQHLAGSKLKLTDLNTQLQELVLTRNECSSTRAKLNAELTQLEQQLLGVRIDKAESDKEAKFSAAIIALQRLYPGVRGRLSTLCRPTQKRYHTAVATALGKNLHAIIVDTKRTALESIRYLKEQRVGTATFLPLESLHVTPSAADALRQQIGMNIKLVRDVIDADESIQKALLYACGDTLLAENLDEARMLAFGTKRYKVVTITGELLHKSGNMSGGCSVADSGPSSASTWDRSAVTSLKSQKDECIERLSTLPTEADLNLKERDISSAVTALTTQIRYNEQERAVAQEKLDNVGASIDDCDIQLSSLQPETHRLTASIVALKARVQILSDEIDREEDDVFSSFGERMGIADIRQFEERFNAAQRAKSDRLLNLSTRIGRCQSQIEYYNTMVTRDEELAQMRESIHQKKEQIKAIQYQINQITTAKEGTAKELKSLTEKSFSLKTIAFADQAALKAFNDELADFKSKSGEVQSRINALDAECSKIHQRRRDMLQVCRLEQITIPIVNKKKTSKRRRSSTVSDSEDNGALASDQEDLEIDRSTSASQSQLDVQDIAKVEPNTIDYRKLRHEREILNAEHYNALQQDFEDEVARIHSEMESLAPNLKSFDKFDEMKDRIASAGADFEAAKVLSKEAADSFNVSRQQRLDKFMDAFNHVSNSIDEIYKQLTRSARFPLGGTAHLSLENPDDPFNNGIKFHAMPPMKRFRDMEQLSGGEKTVAALALLFAIHNYRPSPFFVLDEVDAALDKANVTKVARYVRYRAHEDNLQCIVISLKDTFFDKSDALIGVFKDRTNNSSGCITLDLNKYGD